MNTENKIKRDDIVDFCKKVKQKSEKIQNSKNHILIKKMAQQISDRTETIKDLCDVKKYNLYFNGKVAIGKSTAICMLFKLINKNELKENSRLSDLLLLKTGSGRTTICETQVYPNSDGTAIKIERVSNQDFDMCLTQFCKWLNSKESDISEEEIRLIKNMLSIPLKWKSQSDIMNYLNLTNSDSLFGHLSKVIDYGNRIKLEFKNDNNEAFEKWIKENFVNINDGKDKDAPMPRRISIYVNELDFKLSVPEFINAIIDTRGLDGGERVDIQNYIKERDSLSLMCDEVNAFGGNESIISILEQILILEEKDTKYRVALLGLEKGEELSNITDCVDRQDGIEAKKIEAKKKMKDNTICFEDENIFFVNALDGIYMKGNTISSIDIERKDNEKQNFFNNLEKMLFRMYTNYYSELCEALKIIDQLEIGQITKLTLDKLEDCKNSTLEIKEKIENSHDKLISQFKDAILSIYHSSLRGAVNHNGVGYTADVYASFKKCGGEVFSNNCNLHKAELVALVDRIFKGCTKIEEICHSSIRNKINSLYSKYYDTMRDNVYNETKENLENNSSWSIPQTYWGDSLGYYNQRVCNDIMNEIKTKKIDLSLEKLELEKKLFTEIADYLTL